MRAIVTSWAVLSIVGFAEIAVAERVITGTVVDARTGAPIAGAVVGADDLEATTTADGTFRLEGVTSATMTLVIVADGYGPHFASARFGVPLVIRMAAEAAGTELIELSGRAPHEAPQQLSATEVRSLPGAGNDALRALQGMPGAARTPIGLGGLAIRGTAPRDTNVYFDGLEIPLLYHFGGLASFVPTAMIQELSLEASGAGVRYGRGIGGVAVVTSRSGRSDRWRVGGELSLLHAALVAEGPGPLDGNWLIATRRSYFDAIIAASDLDLTLLPRYMDAQLRWESGDGKWMAILFGSDDLLRLNLDPDQPGPAGLNSAVKGFHYVSRFARLGLRYRAQRGATSFTFLPSIGIDDVEARVNHHDLDKGMHRWALPLSLRAEVETPLARGRFAAGIDAQSQHHAYDILNTPPASPGMELPDVPIRRRLARDAADIAAWIEESWLLAGGRIDLRPGLRLDYLGLPELWTLDPRLSVEEKLPRRLSLQQSIGIYHSPPFVTDLDPIFGGRVMPASKAVQVAAGGKAELAHGVEVSATGYYQHLRQLPVDAMSAATPLSDNGGTDSGGLLAISRELVDEQFGSYTYREGTGKGYAYGVELVARKSVGGWSGWLAYTHGRSFRKNPNRDDGYLPYVLDQPHSFSALATFALGESWRAGGRFRYVSGNPFTPVGDRVYQDEEWTPIDGPLLSERLPAFIQLDLRIDRAWRRGWGSLNLYLDIQNVTNRRNAEGVTYNEDFSIRSYVAGMPIFPSLGLEYIP